MFIRLQIIKKLIILPAAFCLAFISRLPSQLSVIYVELLEEFKESHAKTSLVESVCKGFIFGAGIISGLIVEKYEVQRAGIFASLLAGIGLSCSYFATNVVFMVVTIGIISGFGFSMTIICAYTSVRNHFDGTKLIVATSFISFFESVSILSVPLLAEYLIQLYGFRGTLLITGGIALHGVPAALVCIPSKCKSDNTKLRPVPESKQATSGSRRKAKNDMKNTEVTSSLNVMKNLIRNKAFVLFGFGNMMASASALTFLVFVIDFYESLGLSRSTAVFALFILNLTSMVMRFSPALVKRIPHVSLIALSVVSSTIGCTIAFIFPNAISSEHILVLSGLIGIAIGGVLTSLYTGLHEIIDASNTANAIGMIHSLCSIGVISVAPISGKLRDVTGSYYPMCYTVGGLFGISCLLFIITMIFNRTKK